MNGADVFYIIRSGTSGGTADDLDGEPTVRVTPEFSQCRFVVENSSTTLWQLNYGTDADDPANGIKRPRDYNALTNAKVWKRVLTAGGGGGTPGGADTQAQFNDAGAFGGDPQYTYDKTSHQLKFLGSASIALGFNDDAAQTGRIRLDNGGAIYARNADDDADILLLVSNGAPGGDSIVIGNNATGYIETRHGSVHEFVIQSADPGQLSITSAGDLSINGTGNVSLSGAPIDLYPVGPVTIHDVLKLTPTADPNPLEEGMVWAGTDHHFYYYNGTIKKQLDN